jgi:hypothetical protein
MMKLATKAGRKKEKANIPIRVNQVNMPGITSKTL